MDYLLSSLEPVLLVKIAELTNPLDNQAFQQGAATTEPTGRQDGILLHLILGMVGGRKELFILRLVCKKWNEVVMVLLVPLTTPRETEWRPEDQPRQLALPAPTLIVKSTYQRLIVELGTEEIQPASIAFPTKSLTIKFEEESVDANYPARLQQVFGNITQNLKSLCIFNGSTTSGITQLLQTPNLKVQKMFRCVYLPSHLDGTLTPNLSSLENLSLGYVPPYTCKLLLEIVSKHLVILELDQISDAFEWDTKNTQRGCLHCCISRYTIPVEFRECIQSKTYFMHSFLY